MISNIYVVVSVNHRSKTMTAHFQVINFTKRSLQRQREKTNACKMNILTRTRAIFPKFNVRYYNGQIGIVGVPFDKGQEKQGVARGPEVIRAAGLIQILETLGLQVRDYGDVSYDEGNTSDVTNMSHYSDVASCTKRLSERVQQMMRDCSQIVTIGGDHSVVVGSIDGHIKEKQDVAVIWVDAHADLNTNKTSDSGNVHGMPAALLISELSDYWPYLPNMDWQRPMLSIRNIAYIGLRSVDRYERLIIEKHGVTVFGMEDIERYGIHNVFHMAMNKIDPHNKKSLHVSFDIDSLDPIEAPSTGTPVRGGLHLREALYLVEQIYKTHRLNAIDLVEVNPQIGNDHDVKTTVEASLHVVQAALGYTRRGLIVPKGVTDMPLQTFHNV